MIRILIADDHAIVREGLKQIVQQTMDIVVAGEASNAAETLEMVRKLPIDLLLLDISMPGRSGLDVLVEIKRDLPNLPVLILSLHPEDQYALRMLKAGAAGYVTKESASEQLIHAIRKVASGGKYMSMPLAEKLVFGMVRDQGLAPHELLSNREFQVFRMIAAGKSVGEIAEELSLSAKTISTNRARIIEKMGLRNNAEFTQYAIQHKLLDATVA
ncbi:MAG: response regulator transcription factor [Bacteroidota bacterium]|nr:response regulator transcription factor [Bacteroidota bacterium]MDP4234506.1 response regulator transcription factor [Bacteroidota bacterium]MDP4242571.1 response regulator transcription factor [Bacteroidota bacterium]MDP4288085.1 response regulator transcription factor [Bacteroidota bacterium]